MCTPSILLSPRTRPTMYLLIVSKPQKEKGGTRHFIPKHLPLPSPRFFAQSQHFLFSPVPTTPGSRSPPQLNRSTSPSAQTPTTSPNPRATRASGSSRPRSCWSCSGGSAITMYGVTPRVRGQRISPEGRGLVCHIF